MVLNVVWPWLLLATLLAIVASVCVVTFLQRRRRLEAGASSASIPGIARILPAGRAAGGAQRWLLPAGACLVAACVWAAAFGLRGAQAGERFDFLRWEVQSLPAKVLYRLGRPFRADPSVDEALVTYFAASDRSSPAASRLENAVEATIERRIGVVLAEQGIHWPPVAIELAASPRVLVVSPRTRIERIFDDPLRPDLTPADVDRIERAVEQDQARSALVVRTGGVATYPAIVLEGDDYAGTVAAAAHEWTHHYLTFHPLGLAYFSSAEARTINETVADMVGEELARMVVARWGIPGRVGSGDRTAAAATTPAPATVAVDVDRALRTLRLEVDALLADGRVTDAESRMAAVRDELAAAGVRYRRINQAFFAWTGSYAARPDAVDPLGAQLRALRAHSPSLEQFLVAVQRGRTRAEVERITSTPP